MEVHVRVLLTPYIVTSHYYQMAGLAWACRAAGHEVRVAAQPAFLGEVSKSGMLGVPVGGNYDGLAGGIDMAKKTTAMVKKANVEAGEQLPPEVLKEIQANKLVPYVKLAEDMAEDLVTFARWWRPDIVISDSLTYAAPLAADTVGAPVVRFLWGLDIAWRVALPGSGISGDEDPRARWPRELTDLYARYGAKPRSHIGIRSLDICPPSLQFPGVPDRMPARYICYNGADVAPPWLLEPAERPRVCVTWGSMSTAIAGGDGFFVPQILKALADCDVDVVVTVKAADRELLGDLPERVRVAENLPLHLLLPSCDAIIHQGGASAMLTAASFGVPQLIIAGLMDQSANAARIAATGAGAGLNWADVTIGAIASGVMAILSEDVRQAARGLKEEIFAQPAPADTVAALEALAAAA
jgi:UDP:flavonoid glycosyltransferase YjiC (YdhE family)